MTDGIRITNPEASKEVGFFLDQVYKTLNARHPGQVTKETEPGEGKGPVLVAILVAVGTGIAANAVYDVLRLVYRKVQSRMSGEETVIVNGERIKLSTLHMLRKKGE